MVNLSLIFITVSTTFNLPAGLLSSICYVESAHKVHAVNVHDGGSPSLGVCQVKSSTAKGLGYKGTNKRLWRNPEINIYYAGKLLRYQLDRYHGDIRKAISAYNMGKHKVNKAGFTCNKDYVTKVFIVWAKQK